MTDSPKPSGPSQLPTSYSVPHALTPKRPDSVGKLPHVTLPFDVDEQMEQFTFDLTGALTTLRMELIQVGNYDPANLPTSAHAEPDSSKDDKSLDPH